MIGTIEIDAPRLVYVAIQRSNSLHALDRQRSRRWRSRGRPTRTPRTSRRRRTSRDLVGRDVELVIRPEQRRARRRLADLRVEERDVERADEEHHGDRADHVLATTGASSCRRSSVMKRTMNCGRKCCVLVGRRHVADHDRVQQLDGDEDRRAPRTSRRSPGRSICGIVVSEITSEARDVGHDAERAGHDQLAHRDGGDLDLARPPGRRRAAAGSRSPRRSARPSAPCARSRAP